MKRFKNILCVVEPGDTCKPALERAVALAENNQAKLTVVDVIPHITVSMRMAEGDTISSDLQAEMVNAHEKQLEQFIEPYRSQLDVQTKVLTGVPFLEIIYEALRNKCDLVIKTPETQDWLDRLFGSDDMHLLRKCPCPVWLIKSQAPKAYKHILAAVDVDEAYPAAKAKSQSALNRQIIKMASSLALAESADLHIVHVWDAIGESSLRNSAFMRRPEQEVNDYVEQTRRQHTESLNVLLHDVASEQGNEVLGYLKPQIHLVKGWPRQVIPVLAQQIEADLVVMGTVARTGVPGFIMGNTAETILNQIDCSVLAIKPPDFVTPVMLKV